MGKLNVKNGTPVGSAHLCRSCSNGQFVTGYRESEVLVICTNASPARAVPFPVCECTGFWDRNRPDYEEMTKLALDFSDGRRKPVRGFSKAGFAAGSPVTEAAPEVKQDPAVEEEEPSVEEEPAFAG